MEAEAAVQLNLGFESSRENIGPFASNRDHDQGSFLGKRFSGSRSFARNLLQQTDQLWKVIIALAVLIFVLFASIAMLMHFAAKVKTSHDNDHHSNHPTALHFKLEKSVSESVASSPPPPPPPSAPVLIEKRPEPVVIVSSTSSTTTTTTTTPSPQITDQQTVNASTNDTTEKENTSKKWSSPCGDWTPYKDERCFQLFTGELRTFDEAVEFCRKQMGASLLSIHFADEQAFFTEWIFKQHKAYDDVWLGARYQEPDTSGGGHFRWVVDGAAVRYSGQWATSASLSPFTTTTTTTTTTQKPVVVVWGVHRPQVVSSNEGAEGVEAGQKKEDTLPLPPPPPKNYTSQDCLHLTAYEGKWDATPCVKRNLVLCERLQPWTFGHLQRLYLRSRKEFAELQKHLHQEMGEQLMAKAMPVGRFVYAQFEDQPPPTDVWPQMTWQELPEKSYYDGNRNHKRLLYWKRIA